MYVQDMSGACFFKLPLSVVAAELWLKAVNCKGGGADKFNACAKVAANGSYLKCKTRC